MGATCGCNRASEREREKITVEQELKASPLASTSNSDHAAVNDVNNEAPPAVHVEQEVRAVEASDSSDQAMRSSPQPTSSSPDAQPSGIPKRDIAGKAPATEIDPQIMKKFDIRPGQLNGIAVEGAA